jgi:aminoglycoside phosphotransferase family enzyme/predicted kinase
MRRLPDDRMMHHLLERNEVTRPMVEAVAEKLATFHAGAEKNPRLARYGDWAIRYNTTENIAQWTPYVGRTLTAEQDSILRAYFQAFYARRAAVLQRRIDDLRIHRVHADLRSDSIVIGTTKGRPSPDDICIFDCVEFSRRVNTLDVARDVGFFQMDLDYRGREDLSRAFVEHYVKVSGDSDLPQILHFYACYSACVRGKVEAFLLDQAEVPAAEKRRAREAARRYFDLACRYAKSLPPAMLVITCGLPATGKSTIARALGERGFEVISSDVVRKELAGIAPTDRKLEGFEGGIYAPDFTQRTYQALLDRARPLLLAGRSVVLDASFNRRECRRAAARLAKVMGAQFACLWFDLSDEVILRLLEARFRKGGGPSDARPDIFAAQKRRFQRPTEIEPPRRITVPGDGTKAAKTRAVVEGLRALSPLSVP